jgi:hypothetical protein
LDFAGVGAALGSSADAARKRVDRALERLRAHLVKRGVSTTAAVLGGALAAHAIEAVPVGLVVSLAAGAGVASASGGGGFISNLMLMTKTKIAVGSVLMAGMLVTPLVLQQQALATARAEQTDLRSRLQSLSAQPSPPGVGAADSFDSAARDRADLERLRGEAKTAQARIAEYSAQAQQLAAAYRGKLPAGIPGVDFFRLSDVRDAGQGTPAAMMQTFVWAFWKGQSNRIRDLMVGDAGLSAQDFQSALDKIMKSSVEIGGGPHDPGMDILQFQIFSEQPGENSDRWVVAGKTREDGTVESSRVLLRPTDGGWKWVVATNGAPVEENVGEQPSTTPPPP